MTTSAHPLEKSFKLTIFNGHFYSKYLFFQAEKSLQKAIDLSNVMEITGEVDGFTCPLMLFPGFMVWPVQNTIS